MGIKRGVDFYSYQQAQFFKEMDLEPDMQLSGGSLCLSKCEATGSVLAPGK